MKISPSIRTLFIALIVTILVFLPQPSFAASYPPSSTAHYLYVFPDGKMYVYDMDNNFSLVYSTNIQATGIRGVAADPNTNILYISYGSDSNNPGSLMKYNLLTNQVVWTKTYQFGVDSIAITPDGKTIYLPAGEESSSNLWYVINAADGSIKTSIAAGYQPHNTVISLNGQHVYMNGVGTPYLAVADTGTNTVTKNIGQLISGGRPFSINGNETLAYTTATGYLGFQVSSITSGNVLYTVPVTNFPNNGAQVPSHGISLSPDEKEIYVLDGVNNYVHVYDVSQVPTATPLRVADIKLTQKILGSVETGCSLDCDKAGWVLHSRNGKYVFIGDDGDIIDTGTRKIVKTLSTLTNTRKYLEIDWQNGKVMSTTSRHGLGYVTTTPTTTPTPTPASPTPTPTGSQTQTVTSYTLINADTDQPITGFDPLANNTTLNLATLPTRNLNIRANTNPGSVGSVRFGYDGNTNLRIENNQPYALNSDEGGNYYAWTPTTGTHSIAATPYSASDGNGTAGTALNITINVVDQANTGSGQTVTSFTLINADTDQPIAGFDPLPNNTTLSLNSLPTKNLNIRANTNPGTVGSVRFGLDSNNNYQTENYLPYALASDADGNYRPWTPSLGTHTVTATPYTNQAAGGQAGTTLSVSLTVTN